MGLGAKQNRSWLYSSLGEMLAPVQRNAREVASIVSSRAEAAASDDGLGAKQNRSWLYSKGQNHQHVCCFRQWLPMCARAIAPSMFTGDRWPHPGSEPTFAEESWILWKLALEAR